MANNRRKKRLVVTIILVVLGLGGAGLYASLRRANNKIDPSKLAKVERGDLARVVVATGKIEPLAKVDVKSKASGIIKNLYVHYGDTVKTGQILAELDKEDLQARLREARATLQAAEANLEAAKAAFEKNKIDAEGPDVPFALKNLERGRKLMSEGLIAQSALDDAEKIYELARNNQLSALSNVSVTRAQAQQASAQVAQARAVLERAEEDLRNSTITSPIDGLVLSRNVEIGDAVSSILVLGSQATLIMTLGDVRQVYVKGKVDESYIGRVYLDQPARITVESFKDKKFTGKVTKISPLGVEKDNVTTFEVRVSIQNPGGELKAMMTANAEIILEEKKGVLQIPEGAILYDKDRKASVEVPDPRAKDGKRKVPLTIGISNGAKTEVIAGLKDGDQVVLQ